MRKVFVFLALLTWSLNFSQDVSTIEFKKETDYKIAEPKVIESASYLLNTPIDSNEMLRIKHLQFLMQWMEGTPDYTFNLTETATKFSGENSNLLGVYLAAMIVYLVKEHGDSKDIAAVEINTLHSAINYVAKKENNVPLTSNLNKLIAGNEKGNLAEVVQKL